MTPDEKVQETALPGQAVNAEVGYRTVSQTLELKGICPLREVESSA